MAYISFYNANATERQHFMELLQGSDHDYEFVEEELSLENSNPKADVISIFVSDNVAREAMEPLTKLKLQSDIISSLQAPAAKETHHLIDKEFLARVKSSAVLVNAARGKLVDRHTLAAQRL